MSVKESIAIFLYIYDYNATPRSIMRIFGHSQESIFRKFYEIIDVMEFMAIYIFKPDPTSLTQIHQKLQSGRHYGSNLRDA